MFIRNTKRHVCCQIISFFFRSIKYNMENVESKNAILKIMLEIVIFELKQENQTHAPMRLHISMTNYKSVFGIRFFFSTRSYHVFYWIVHTAAIESTQLANYYWNDTEKLEKRRSSDVSQFKLLGYYYYDYVNIGYKLISLGSRCVHSAGRIAPTTISSAAGATVKHLWFENENSPNVHYIAWWSEFGTLTMTAKWLDVTWSIPLVMYSQKTSLVWRWFVYY